MKKTFLLSIISTLFLIGCSNDNSEDSNCGSILDPVGNAFTYNCSNYETEFGQFDFESTVWLDGTTTCELEFINEPYDNFDISVGNTNINYIRIPLIVPVDSYYNSEIPLGHYELKHLNTTINEQYLAMDIANFNQAVYNGSIFQPEYGGSPLFNDENLIAAEFDEITVDISKTNNIYTIDYFMKKGVKIVKGNFIGEMQITSH